MATVNEQLNDFNKTAVDAAVRFALVSVDSAERLFALNVATTKNSIDGAARNLAAISSVKDVQELNNLRTKLAESSLEQAVDYSRNVYELSAATQAEYTSLAEDRIATLQHSLVDGLDKIAKTAPAGSDVAVATLKSNLAALTAAYDSLVKAGKQVTTYADAGMKAAADFGTKAAAPKATGKRK
jgi:phasin family protein